MWILYIIKCRDNSLYTGITTDLQGRLSSHLKGTGAKYTKGKGPFEVLYTEQHEDRSGASKREYQIKKLTHQKKFDLIANKSLLRDLSK